MIQFYSLMWILAAFFAIIGAMRGWNKEVIALAGIVLALFALFQFDTLLRGTLLQSFPREQTFVIQFIVFSGIVFFAYQDRSFIPDDTPDRVTIQEAILGGFLGFINGYLIGGTLWYFMDINEYPFTPYVVAPAANSPSAQSIDIIPIVLFGGGVGGTGDLLAVAVIAVFLLVLILL